MDDLHGLLDRVRSRLGAEVIHYLEFQDDGVAVRLTVGAAERYGLEVGGRLPLSAIPGVAEDDGVSGVLVADVAADHAARRAFVGWPRLPGAYLGVPVQLGAGQTVGFLVTLFARPMSHLGSREIETLSFTAGLLGPELVEAGETVHLHHRVRARLRAAMDTGLRMVYQPIVDLGTGETTMVEALARFDLAPTRPPNLWFAEAWRMGLGIDLELAAIRAALADLGRLPAHARLTVNVSVDTLLAGAVHELLDDAPPQRLVLEVTETAVVPNYAELREVVVGLRARGVHLAVDDLGAGFAGLSHLTGLRPEVVKIDRSIVRAAGEDTHHEALIGAVVDFARSTRALLVGEGIETADQLQALSALGVGHGQGYLFAAPGAVDEVRGTYPVAAPAGA